MPNSFTISSVTSDDTVLLAKLVNSAYRGESSRQGWTTEADLLDGTRTTPDLLQEVINKPGTRILKYEEDGKLLACVELKKDGDRLYLGMLTVAPHLQGRGIGKILLKKAEEEARDQACSSIYMTVISMRYDIIEWYKKHGYNETGIRKPFKLPDSRWGIPKLEMEFIELEKLIIS